MAFLLPSAQERAPGGLTSRRSLSQSDRKGRGRPSPCLQTRESGASDALSADCTPSSPPASAAILTDPGPDGPADSALRGHLPSQLLIPQSASSSDSQCGVPGNVPEVSVLRPHPDLLEQTPGEGPGKLGVQDSPGNSNRC